MLHLVAVVCILTLSVQYGEAVKCYVCSSTRDPGCKDPFNKDYNNHKLIDCTQESMRNIHDVIPDLYYHTNYHGTPIEDFACVKAVIRELDREEQVVRSCTIPRTDTFDVCSQLKSDKRTFCQVCTGDKCNAADAAAGPRSLLMTLLPVSVVGLGLLSRAW